MTPYIRKPLLKPYLLCCCFFAATVLAEPDSVASGVGTQPLGDALLVIAKHYKVTVLANDRLVRGISSNEVVFESLSALDAIRLALGNSGLEARYEGETIVIARSDVKLELTNGEKTSRSGSADTAASSALRTEEVIVYGEQINRSVQDTQSSVAVILGDELNRSVARDLFDLLDRTAGAGVQGGNFEVVIRGIPTSGVSNTGSGATIDVTIDGARIPDFSNGPTSTWDLEQVEVFRGAQSTQRGQNSLAGALHLRSASPTFNNDLIARVDLGSLNEQRVALAGNLALSDKVAVRLSGEQYDTDGEIESAFTGEDTSASALDTYRLNARWAPTDSLDIVIGYSRVDNVFGDRGVDESLFPDQRVNTRGVTRQEGETDLAFARGTFDLGANWALRFEIANIETESFTAQEPSPGSSLDGRSDSVGDTLSVDLGATYISDSFRASVGVFASERNRSGSIGGSSSLLGATVTFTNATDISVENAAAYGEIEWRFSADWMLVLGARYDTESVENFSAPSTTVDPPLFELPSAPPERLEADYEALLPKLGLVHNLNEDTSIGFTVQQGYRAGGAFTSLFTGTVVEFDPEFTTNYELALRSQAFDRRLTVNANMFFTAWDDQQVQVPGPSGIDFDSITINAGESELYGFEAEATWSPWSGTDFFLAMAYTHTEFIDFVAQDSEGGMSDFAGNRFRNAPEWSGSIGFNQYWQNGIELSIKGSYTGETYFTAENLPQQLSDDFVIVDARVGYRLGDWATHLYARNLLDDDYISSARPESNFSQAGPPRVVGVSVTYGL
ncbi:MAG: TonB-dependent receptor [Pseudomonadota bacterium]